MVDARSAAGPAVLELVWVFIILSSLQPVIRQRWLDGPVHGLNSTTRRGITCPGTVSVLLVILLLSSCAAPAPADMAPSGSAVLSLDTEDFTTIGSGIAYCLGPSNYAYPEVIFGNLGDLNGEEIHGSIDLGNAAADEDKVLRLQGPDIVPSPLPTPAGDGVPVGWGPRFAIWSGPVEVVAIEADGQTGHLRFNQLALAMESLDATYSPPPAGDRPAHLTGEIRWSCMEPSASSGN